MITETINSIKVDLDKYKELSRSELFTLCINEKLKTTLEDYKINVDIKENYLIRKNAAEILKQLTVMQAEANKKKLEEAANKNKNKDKGEYADD